MPVEEREWMVSSLADGWGASDVGLMLIYQPRWVPCIARRPLGNELRRTVTDIEANLATLALRYKEKHPKMMAARTSLKEAKDSLQRAVMSQPEILRNSIEQAKSTEASLQQQIQEQQGAVVALNHAAIGYQELARQAETDRSL